MAPSTSLECELQEFVAARRKESSWARQKESEPQTIQSLRAEAQAAAKAVRQQTNAIMHQAAESMTNTLQHELMRYQHKACSFALNFALERVKDDLKSWER